jgi:hypothetical protein
LNENEQTSRNQNRGAVLKRSVVEPRSTFPSSGTSQLRAVSQ